MCVSLVYVIKALHWKCAREIQMVKTMNVANAYYYFYFGFTGAVSRVNLRCENE